MIPGTFHIRRGLSYDSHCGPNRKSKRKEGPMQLGNRPPLGL